MDSVTQFLLGAAVGGATLGRQAGPRALLWGGICGTLPDLDVLIPRNDPVAEFTYHRAATHAVFYLTLAAPVIALAMERIHAGLRRFRGRTLLAVWLCLVTHPVLDCFTVYGTQILLPFSEYPVTWSTVFIIDPAYTIPLGIAVILAATRFRGRPPALVRACVWGLAISSAYILATVAVKIKVDSVTREAIAEQNIPAAQFLTTPAPFNAVLWRIVAMTPDGYVEGYYSLLDGSDEIHFQAHSSDLALLAPLAGRWEVERLTWFTKGFYRVSETEKGITISDLRMGAEPYYVFSFRVGKRRNGKIVPVESSRASEQSIPPGMLAWMWRRIWSKPGD